MKTSKSKKLLSFFLAVVMLVTSCSVGFTAFAADGDNGIWNDSTTASDTYKSLNAAFDTYLPQILEAVDANGTLKNAGVDVAKVKSADEPMRELLGELAPTLLGLLGKLSSVTGLPSFTSSLKDKMGTNYNSFSEIRYSYLNDANATTDFWTLYKYYGSDTSSSQYKALDKLYKEYDKVAVAYSNNVNNTVTELFTDFGLTGAICIPNGDVALNLPAGTEVPYSKANISNATSTAGVKLSDYVSSKGADHYTDFVNYVKSVLVYAGVMNDSDALSPVDAIYYYFNTSVVRNAATILLATHDSGSYTSTINKVNGTQDVTYSKSNTFFDANQGAYTRAQFDADILATTGVDVANATGDVKAAADGYYESLVSVSNESEQIVTADVVANPDSSYNVVSSLLLAAGVFQSQAQIDADRESQLPNTADATTLRDLFDANSSESNFLTGLVNSGLTYAEKLYVANELGSTTFAAMKSDFLSWTPGGAKTPAVNDFINNTSKYYPLAAYGVAFGNLQGVDKTGYIGNKINSVSTLNSIIDYKLFSKDITVKFDGKDPAYAISNDDLIELTNDTLNTIVTMFLDPSTTVVIGGMSLNIGQIVGDLLDQFMETKNVDLAAQLTDLYKNLADKPIETVFNLLPLLVCLLDEVIEPLVLNGNGDANYAGGDGFLYGLLSSLFLGDYTQTHGSYVGLGRLRIDLNTELPAIMHWVMGDTKSDAAGTYYVDTETGAKHYYSYYGGASTTVTNPLTLNVESYLDAADGNKRKYNINITGSDVQNYTAISGPAGALTSAVTGQDKDGKDIYTYYYDGKSSTTLSDLLSTYDGDTFNFTMTYSDKVPVFFNIYLIDKALAYANINTLNVSKDANTNTLAKEAISDVGALFTQAVDKYVYGADGHVNDVKYINDDGKPVNKGLNNLFVSIPRLLDIMGNLFIDKYNIDSDWSYSYKLKANKYGGENNTSLDNFKALAGGNGSNKSKRVLENFVNIFVNDWLNSIIDLLNDTTASSNGITKQTPIIKGLIDALGGLGSKSMISDALNGVFQLKYDDEASFVMGVYNTKSGYSGLSVKSAYYLLSNVGQIIELIRGIFHVSSITQVGSGAAKANPLSATYATKNPGGGKSVTQPAWADVPATSSAAGDTFVSRLDAALSGLLEGSTINNFNMNTNAGLFSGIISLVSYYLGSDNNSDIVKLLNAYLYQLNDQDKKGTNTSKSAVYTQDRLTNLVVQTYSLLENIIEYYLTEQDAVKVNVFYDSAKKIYSDNASGLYTYNILTAALEGLISPHAVSTHFSDAGVAKKLASLDSWHSAIKISGNNNSKTGVTAISVNWGFSNGDTNSFFKNMGEGLGIITDVVGVLLCNSSTASGAGLYDSTLYPLLKDIEAAQTANLGVYAKGTVNDGVTALLSIINPVSNLLTAFYAQPASALLNLIKGVSLFISKDLSAAFGGVRAALYNEVCGISKILSTGDNNAYLPSKGLMPSMAKDNLWLSKILSLLPASSQATVNSVVSILVANGPLNIPSTQIVGLINSLIASFGIALPESLFDDIAGCANAQAVLDYILQLVVKIVTSDGIINALKKLINNSSLNQLLDMLSQLSYDKIMAIINTVLDKTKDPTEVYWTFLQYVQKETTGFYYPAGVTANDAEDAIDQLDAAVASVMSLLNGFDVVKSDNLKDIVSPLIFKNSNITAIASALYGALEGDVALYMGYMGIDTSTDGVAALLKDKSYGKTYSSAAKTLTKYEKWSDVAKANVNWGFTDGSAKAEQGFINALAAVLRPLNNVLTLLLAGDSIALGDMLTKLVQNLDVKISDTVSFKDGFLTIKVKGKDQYTRTSTIKLDIDGTIKAIKDLKVYGGNGYENAVVPILEALMCDNVKTYAQYKKDITKAKDSVLLDVLNPIMGLLNDVLDAPFDALTKRIPNIAYFIDNNGLSQAVNNLLNPITSLLPALKANGLDVNKIIKTLLGKSLNSVVTDALGVNIHLNINDLNSCELQNAIVPLLNTLLKKLNIKLPAFTWAKLASHGEVQTVKSAAKNSQGKYTTKQVQARQGEVLIAVLRYVAKTLTSNMSTIKGLLGGLKIKDNIMSIINVVLDNLSTASSDQLIQAIFYFLKEEPTNAFWNYSNYKTKSDNFSYPKNMDIEFLTSLSPMVDGLLSGLIDLNETISKAVYKDSIINSLAKLIYPSVEGVKVGNMTLTELLAQTGIDFTKSNFAALLTDSSYGKAYSANASAIDSASSWSKVNFDNLKWGVKDRDSFFHALCAVLRPVYPVLDVLLNDASLGLFNIVSIPGSNGYTSVIVPLLEAFGCYNVKTQYQYREDISKTYDSVLLDVINPLWDKVEDILSAPLQTLTSMLANLSLFIANDGLLQLIENLFVPVSALLDALKPIVNVNDLLTAVLDMLNVDLDKTLSGLGLKLDLNIDLYDLTKTLKPIIGSDNIVPLLNQVIGLIKIKGTPLGIELMDIDWYLLASHGEVIVEASQAATYGARIHVNGDSSETLIAVLRFLVNTVNYKDNYNTISSLISSLLGDNVSSSISDVIDTVLGLLKGDTDDVISQLCELLQTFA